jgi:hypothetical protein
MSDASANPSCESPASPTASVTPLPIPSRPQDEVSIEVDEDETYLVHSPEDTANEPEDIQIPDQLSPALTLTIIQNLDEQAPGASTQIFHRLAEVAARTLAARTRAHVQEIEDYREELRRARTGPHSSLVESLRGEIARLRASAAPDQVDTQPPTPHGFITNGGRLPHFTIPHQGHKATARYIRVCPSDPTTAQGTMGRPQDPVYCHSLYAITYWTPVDDDSYPQEPLPEWFRDLIHATEPCFRTLLQGARILEDWGVTADIARYRATSERLRDLAAAREGIDAALTAQRETLDLVTFRLGSARAAERLSRYQNLADEVASVRHEDHTPVRIHGHRAGRARGRA